jgi:hypothetical protein
MQEIVSEFGVYLLVNKSAIRNFHKPFLCSMIRVRKSHVRIKWKWFYWRNSATDFSVFVDCFRSMWFYSDFPTCDVEDWNLMTHFSRTQLLIVQSHG